MAEIKCSCYLLCEGDEPVPLQSLAPEQKERCRNAWAERLTRVSSAYFSQHPEEYAAL